MSKRKSLSASIRILIDTLAGLINRNETKLKKDYALLKKNKSRNLPEFTKLVYVIQLHQKSFPEFPFCFFWTFISVAEIMSQWNQLIGQSKEMSTTKN